MFKILLQGSGCQSLKLITWMCLWSRAVRYVTPAHLHPLLALLPKQGHPHPATNTSCIPEGSASRRCGLSQVSSRYPHLYHEGKPQHTQWS